MRIQRSPYSSIDGYDMTAAPSAVKSSAFLLNHTHTRLCFRGGPNTKCPGSWLPVGGGAVVTSFSALGLIRRCCCPELWTVQPALQQQQQPLKI